MPYDILLVLQALTTRSAGFDSTAVDLKVGTPRHRSLKARVIVPAMSQQGGNGVVKFNVQHSLDNTTFLTIASSDPITNSATAVAKEIFVPFETTNRYVRLNLENTISTGTAAVAYVSDIGLVRP
jgi:hypothetical protein